MKQYLKEQIKNHIARGLESEVIDPEEIRMISVGPLHGAELMGLWFSNEWERYEYLDDKEPHAAFSLHEWRDDLLSREKAIASGREDWPPVEQNGPLPLFYPGFSDSAASGPNPVHSLIVTSLQVLRKDLHEALQELASEDPCSQLTGVALCEFGLSHASHPVAVAYCHPEYRGRLYGLMEHRGDDILYPDACFTEDSILLFFPEGESEDEEGEPCVTHYSLEALESFNLSDRRDDEILFRFKGELTDRRIGAGHHDEDMGWPSSKETGARLAAFFEQKPELHFDPQEFPYPAQREVLQAWIPRFVASGSRKGTRLVQHIIAEHGLDTVPLLLDAPEMRDFADRPKMELAYISELVDARQYEGALQRIETLAQQNPHFAADTRLLMIHSLIGLERWEDAWSAIQSYRQENGSPLSEVDAKTSESLIPADLSALELLLALRLDRLSDAIVANALQALEDASNEDKRLLQISLLTLPRSTAARSGLKAEIIAELEEAFPAKLAEELGLLSADISGVLRRILSSGPVPFFGALLAVFQDEEILQVAREWSESAKSVESFSNQWKSAGTSAATEKQNSATLADRRAMDYLEVPGHWWMPEQTFRTDLKRPFHISLRNETIFGTDDDGLFVLDPKSGELKKHPIANSRIRSYAFHPEYESIVYAMDKDRGLVIYDLENGTVQGERASSHWAQFDYIETRGSILAIGGGVVDFFDISDPIQPKFLTSIGIEYRDTGSFLLEDDRLYLVIARKGLFTVDISGLSAAHREVRLLAHIPWNRGGQYRLQRFENYLLADGGAMVFDLSDSDNPTLVAANDLSLDSQAFAMDGSLWAADSDARMLFFQAANLAGKNRQIRFEPRKELEEDQDLESMSAAELSKASPQYRASEALAMKDRVLIRQGDDILIMRRIEAPASGFSEIAKLFSPVQEKVYNFVINSLMRHKEEHGSVGGIILGFVPWQKQFELQVYGPISILATGHRADNIAVNYQIKPFDDSSEAKPSGDSKTADGDTDIDALFASLFEGNTSHESFVAAQDWCASLYDAIKSSDAFQSAASGICYFLSLEPRRIVSLFYDADRPHEVSWKEPVQLSGQDLVGQLEGSHGYEYIEEAGKAADNDPDLFGRLMDSAAAGHKWSQRVAINFLDLSKDGSPREEPWEERETAVIEALGRASQQKELAEFVLGGLRNYASHPAARALLERELKSDDQEMSIRAGVLLGLAESDFMIDRVRDLLAATNDYQAADLADLVLKRISDRLEELVPDLEAWMERADAMDNRVPQLARHLFRAGAENPPARLLEQSSRAKSDEQYHSNGDSMGLGPDEMDESVAAERLWTCRAFAVHIAKLANADDRKSSLWPPELPVEPWPASYRYVLEGAKQYLANPLGTDLTRNWRSIAMQPEVYEKKKEGKSKSDTSANIEAAKKRAKQGSSPQKIETYLDWFYDALADHALPGEDPRPAIVWLKDRIKAMTELQQKGKITGQTMLDFVRRTQKAPRDAFEKGYWNQLAELEKLYSVQCAWDHVAREEFESARTLADSLLSSYPRDGQVLFLDARLRWRMDSIDACIGKLDAYIAQASDDTGKARLLNLYGCALDEQKKYDEALPYFQKAYQLQPEESMYRKNLAEIHEKLGNLEEAKAWTEGRQN